MGTAPVDIDGFLDYIKKQESYPARALDCIRAMTGALATGSGWHNAQLQMTEAMAGGTAVGPATLKPDQLKAIEAWKKNWTGPDRLSAYLVHCDLIRRFALAARNANAQQGATGHVFDSSSGAFWTGFVALATSATSGLAGLTASDWGVLGSAIESFQTVAPYVGTMLTLSSFFAWYWEGYDPHNQLTEALAGPAYKALGINDNIGRLIDNAHERYFIQHLLEVVKSAGAMGEPTHHLSTMAPPLRDFSANNSLRSRKWCTWVDAELRAWIKLNFRVNVSETEPKRLGKTGNEAINDAVGAEVARYKKADRALAFCGSRVDPGKFVDFAEWRAGLAKTPAKWAVSTATA